MKYLKPFCIIKREKLFKPVGVENFDKLITRGYCFIDKTLFIKELLDKRGDVNLFTRPRRFGKTLSLSMLQYFFEDDRDTMDHLWNFMFFTGYFKKVREWMRRTSIMWN